MPDKSRESSQGTVLFVCAQPKSLLAGMALGVWGHDEKKKRVEWWWWWGGGGG